MHISSISHPALNDNYVGNWMHMNCVHWSRSYTYNAHKIEYTTIQQDPMFPFHCIWQSKSIENQLGTHKMSAFRLFVHFSKENAQFPNDQWKIKIAIKWTNEVLRKLKENGRNVCKHTHETLMWAKSSALKRSSTISSFHYTPRTDQVSQNFSEHGMRLATQCAFRD